MKKSLFIILLIMPVFLFAQKDPEAKSTLDKAWNKINNYKAIRASFLFEVNKGGETTDSYEGKVVLKGKKFWFESGETIIYSDGKTRWVYMPEEQEVNVAHQIEASNLEPEERLMNAPLSLFEIYKSGFKYKNNGELQEQGKTFFVVEISPENKEKPYFKVRYWFNSDYSPYRVKIFQKDGSRITFTIKDLKEDKGVKDSEFRFDEKKHPNVDVIDLRE